MRTTQAHDDANSHWDVIVIGTGMGGAMAGYALAKAGKKVLFCERGKSLMFGSASNVVRGRYAEVAHQSSKSATESWAQVLFNAGRVSTSLIDRSGDKATPFIPFAGSGTGGSTSIFGGVMQRLAPEDFVPGENFPSTSEANLPARWPITYEQLQPYYQLAEKLFNVRGSCSPLREQALDPLPPREPIADADPAKELTEHFRARGLHPYQPPMAFEKVPGCLNCQGYLCPMPCRKDSTEVGLKPALELHGAQLFTETEVVELIADKHSVTKVVCLRNGRRFSLSADLFVLAAGAFETPKLLLNSRSRDWPNGLANQSGWVGRNLMRRYFDLYWVYPKGKGAKELGKGKEIYLDDFFVKTDEKLGIIQSFGEAPHADVFINGLEQTLSVGRYAFALPAFRRLKPLLRVFFERRFQNTYPLISTMEDLPYLHNRVYPSPSSPSVATIEYRISASEAQRIKQFRDKVETVLKPYRFMQMKMAEDNQVFIAVSCGTCRFGDDPKTSVLNAQNRAHGIDNLYVVDGSFFPTASALNPALTIAANALRVADHILRT